MSTPLEIIQIVESSGGRFMVDGDRLGITPQEAADLVLEELRLYKLEIIDMLGQRPVMPTGVRLISWQLKTPPIRLSRSETVTGTQKFVAVTLAQLDAELNGQCWLGGNWGISGLLDRLSICGCVVALDDPRRLRQ